MKCLLENDYLAHYNLHRTNITVKEEQACDSAFDLIDDDKSPMIVPYQTGTGSFLNAQGVSIHVINYEKFVCDLSGTAFERGLKRCDFLLYSSDADDICVFNEHTSSTSGISGLKKPIVNKKTGNVEFAGGKYEKVELQLAVSLGTLMSVPTINKRISGYKRKVCLMSYRLENKSTIAQETLKAFGRYRQVEAKNTGENGAMIPNSQIEALGFEYRRISHEFAFALS